MKKTELGRLEKVELREVFGSEARDFTPWLAQEENLALLGEVINLELELESQEKDVGPFRADLMCKALPSEQWVVVENQIEKTDHTHLGQLLTYAAGLEAGTIVWIASEFNEQHRAALDWLNEITKEGINFFGLEIELWRIGGSPVAPRFNIISKPNEWAHTVKSAASAIEAGSLGPTKKLQLDYWTDFHQFLHQRKGPVRPQKPLPQHWMNLAIGRSGFYLMAFTNTREHRIGVLLVMGGDLAKPHYYLLEKEREAIEDEFGTALEWRALPGRTESHILFQQRDADLTKRARWPEYIAWMAEIVEKFHAVFAKRVRLLDADDYQPDEAIGEIEPGIDAR